MRLAFGVSAFLSGLIMPWLAAGGDPPATRPVSSRPASAPTSLPAARVVDFQPGLRIDWTRRQVIVEATVIMREGTIELFACSPRMREHEAIVRIEARPSHLFQALGLIGLTPGEPVRYDAGDERMLPATGDLVEIDVRWTANGAERIEPIEHWMQRMDGTSMPERLPWVFAGSMALEAGGLAVDQEGTVIALVDFSSSLIALPDLHSDSNEELWLKPNTARIPPVGTVCELLLRSGPLELQLDAAGRAVLHGRVLSDDEVTRLVRGARREHPGRRVRVRVVQGCAAGRVEQLVRLLAADGGAAEAPEVLHAR